MSRVVLKPFNMKAVAEIDWDELIGRVLPEKLPHRHELCKAVLKSLFQRELPEGVLQAASSLVELDREYEARALLVDFFRERRGAPRVGRRLEMQLLFQKRRDALSKTPFKESESATRHVIPSFNVTGEPDETGALELEFKPSPEVVMPQVDDSEIRALAGKLQTQVSETPATYSLAGGGATTIDWDDLDDGRGEPGPATRAQSEVFEGWTERHEQLVDRLAALGDEGIALLRYFHVNPGDGAKHAAEILDYELANVNKLLNNRLREYVRRSPSGGWECIGWVSRLLELMPK